MSRHKMSSRRVRYGSRTCSEPEGQAMKLTQRRIDDLVCPDGRRDLMVFDDE